MELKTISLAPIQGQTVAILGYGNQGRAQALNLRDSQVTVKVGARPGKGWDVAVKDGFAVHSFAEAAAAADVVMFLLPDHIIPQVYGALAASLREHPRTIGFAHGFAFHFAFIEPIPDCSYFLVGPKGAGAILRAQFAAGGGLPGVFAVAPGAKEGTKTLCTSYAKAIGLATSILIETTFAEETECDLFGEQAVLCGGIMQLMETAYDILVNNGHSPEMAFFECCFEARMILELWMKFGPHGLSEQISPTAFYGGSTRGPRLVTVETRKEMEKIFQEIRSGAFAKEWMAEAGKGMPSFKPERTRLRNLSLQKIYEHLQPALR